jgi:hypothetical protein
MNADDQVCEVTTKGTTIFVFENIDNRGSLIFIVLIIKNNDDAESKHITKQG